jgi:phosphatidylglycerol:prolipoprotein diacylglycerol transferase
MYPRLFSIPLPKFLQDLLPFLPESLTFYSYGVMIGLGILISYLYAAKHLGKLGLSKDRVSNLVIYLIIAAFVGGKVLFYLENPSYYIENPKKLIPTGSGFVFYGSLLFAVPTLIYFLRKWSIQVWPALDVIAICTLLLHGFGRIGCFLAGCCHGRECDAAIGVVFSHPESRANPLDTPLYPTQITEATILFITAAFLHFYMRKRKKFEGQLFLLYVMIYAVARSILEIFRGDEARGFLVGDWLSHSQFISLLVFVGAVIFWIRMRKTNSATL